MQVIGDLYKMKFLRKTITLALFLGLVLSCNKPINKSSLDLDSGQVITIYPEVYSGRSANGTTVSFVRNSTMTRTATGRWQIRFNTPHTEGVNYSPDFESEEQSNLRDTQI